MSDIDIRYAVLYPDGTVTALNPEETIDEAIEFLRCVHAEAQEFGEDAADDVTGACLARVSVEIIETFPDMNGPDAGIGRA